jgi:ferredoxin
VVEGYWFSMLSQSVMSWFGGNNGALRARAFGGHEDADVEQDQMRSCQTKACRLQSRQERLVVKTQARPSSKRGKNKVIKSRVEEVGSSRAMRYSNASASRNQRRPAEISVNAEKSVLCKKCQKMVRCQACRRAERACNAIGTGTEACSSRSSVSEGDDLSLSL